jgi:hypothetical protein
MVVIMVLIIVMVIVMVIVIVMVMIAREDTASHCHDGEEGEGQKQDAFFHKIGMDGTNRSIESGDEANVPDQSGLFLSLATCYLSLAIF